MRTIEWAKDELPGFDKITVSEIEPAMDQVMSEGQSEIESLLANGQFKQWDDLVIPLEEIGDKLDKVWSPISHLHSVKNSDDLRQAYHHVIPKLTEYYTSMGHHQGLYQAYCGLDEGSFTPVQQKYYKDVMRAYRLNGVSLPDAEKEQYKALQKKKSKLTTSFEENVLDATQSFEYLTTNEEELKGLPAHTISEAAKKAEEKGLEGYRLTLDFPCYHAIMCYGENRALRETFYKAYTTRSSELGPDGGKFDNSQHMQDILKTRFEIAKLLGFDNYAELSLESKMAENVEQVEGFLMDLAARSKHQAQREYEALKTFAKEQGYGSELAPWDLSFISERMSEQQFEVNQEKLRAYFPEAKVLDGMFAIIERLYGLTFRAASAPTWHNDVRFFELFNEKQELIGKLYMDLFARSDKRGGAWMDECLVRRRRQDGSLQLPVAFLNCNFAPPNQDGLALLTHNEVNTLFHEMGHCLHHLMTQMEYAGISGINGVAWDAVELPSQFFENWCWQAEAIPMISEHFETKEALPQAEIDNLIKAKNFHSALAMLRQLEFSLFDLRIHKAVPSSEGVDIYGILQAVRDEISVIPVPEYNRFPNSFSHIFAGGYAAGYYSYKWAEVLSADAFSRFEEEGIFNEKTGRDFWSNILAQGGAKEPMDCFKAFRGREPTIEPLLAQSGIKNA